MDFLKNGKKYKRKSQSIVCVHCGKGGRKRTVIVLPEYESHIERMAKMTKENEKIFKTIPRGVQAHYYRACYAQAYYIKIARAHDC